MSMAIREYWVLGLRVMFSSSGIRVMGLVTMSGLLWMSFASSVTRTFDG